VYQQDGPQILPIFGWQDDVLSANVGAIMEDDAILDAFPKRSEKMAPHVSGVRFQEKHSRRETPFFFMETKQTDFHLPNGAPKSLKLGAMSRSPGLPSKITSHIHGGKTQTPISKKLCLIW
jgi:hypothetical protein